MQDISLLAAFAAGVVSFVSPCVLPLVPGYLSFISGVSLDDLRVQDKKTEVMKTAVISSMLFGLGFTVVFVGMGATASIFGQFLLSKISLFNRIAGVLVIIFGLHTLGIIKLKFLMLEKRFHYHNRPAGLFGSAFVIGLSFAFGWTPCLGPILAGILTLASSQETVLGGVKLLFVYSLGLGLPFLLAAIAINYFFTVFNKVKKHFRMIEVVSGLLLIGVGLLLFTDNLQKLAGFFTKLGLPSF
ncbi:MAG: cytochrome c biogenesis protein CcdA [Candidatus Tectomicrobia bacterium]|uniref:Cytochrome c biogenesis protein CcdA n=1 Tax=Tectimicrobiota bacterium TaxID=2528274 RepID=A0A933GJK1_UNCTE|nr:cytochrome c biogenesis protein CcdA [Candidatus Tectomicrobia bacterium]